MIYDYGAILERWLAGETKELENFLLWRKHVRRETQLKSPGLHKKLAPNHLSYGTLKVVKLPLFVCKY